MNFIDTNILVYAYDLHEKDKRVKCSYIVKSILSGEEKASISNQVLSELFYVLTRDMRKPLIEEKAEEIVETIIKSDNWIKVNYTCKTLSKAMYFAKEFKIHFWDALIAATMLENNVFTIYTENVNDFKKIPMLKVINPLA